MIAFSFVRKPVFMEKKQLPYVLKIVSEHTWPEISHMSQNLQKITFLCNAVSF